MLYDKSHYSLKPAPNKQEGSLLRKTSTIQTALSGGSEAASVIPDIRL